MNTQNSAGSNPWTDSLLDADDLEPEGDGYQPPSAYNETTGKLYLASDQCHDCVFAKAGRCLDLGPGRLKELAGDLRRRDDFLLCHNTYAPLGPPGAQPAICRGYFDAYGVEITAIRMAKILGLLVEIDPPAAPQQPPRSTKDKDQ
ncbi:hypothetical protein [Catenulispora rubra]|uniref:hypothetical protein n=1 Tax=Catenulispora rubra TaxID=280293 RepID=UPI00189258E1|nr:hypothetical protein [Catenulispora rubra]